MHCMSERDFIEEYGDNRAVASLAVLAEDAITGRRRIIHDATHGVRVNHRIQCRDKVRMPGPREKAHRRFKYQASEQGLLARKASSNSETIYVNRMGTFGVPSPYWWGRLSAALMRLTHWVVGPSYRCVPTTWRFWGQAGTVGRQHPFLLGHNSLRSPFQVCEAAWGPGH